MRFAFKGTRDNQLFLTNTVHQKIPNFKPIYDWFRHNLVLVAPDSRFGPLEMFIDEQNPLYSTYNNLLAQLDTGIASLGGEDVEVDRLGLPEALKSRLAEEVPENTTVTLRIDPENERIVMTRKGGELKARRLVARHENSQGELVRFDFRHESDGTQRAIDLVPGFLDLMSAGSRRVYVIDEIDRSLHTLLIRKLIEAYLDCCGPDSRTQLLFTTHDVLLMDQRLLRRDEMWVTERDDKGCSTLFSFSEYKDVRFDKDIRKSYLQGRMGGIPRILLTDPACAVQNGQPADHGER